MQTGVKWDRAKCNCTHMKEIIGNVIDVSIGWLLR